MRTLLSELLSTSAMILRSPDEGGAAASEGAGGEDPAAAAAAAGETGDGGEKGGADGNKGAAASDANGGTQDFPENWREQLAGDDKSALKSLTRYKAPQDMWKAHQQQTRSISERGLARPKEGSSDEEFATWRKDNDIPSSKEDFQIELADGRTLGDDDKPIADSLMAYSVEKDLNLTQSQMNGLFDWYFSGLLEQSANAVIDADDQLKADTLTILTEAWGQDYRGNISRGELVFKDADPDFMDMMLTARDSQNRIISQTHLFKQEMARLGRIQYPADIPIGGDINASIKDLTSRRSELEKMMGDPRSDYWKGAASAGLQSEYRDIIDSQTRLKA